MQKWKLLTLFSVSWLLIFVGRVRTGPQVANIDRFHCTFILASCYIRLIEVNNQHGGRKDNTIILTNGH
jgi:uncharacterized membrane protein YGL010W